MHMTKTNPVYLTNEHFLPNSRKSVASSEIAFGNEKEFDKLKLDQRKSLCEGYQMKDQLIIENQLSRQFGSSNLINSQRQLYANKIAKDSKNRLYESPENSIECPLLDQLNSLAASSECATTEYQSLVAKNSFLKPNPNNNGKFKCSRLANIGLLSNVASLSQTGVRVSPHQSKMSRLLGNRKLDLKQVANKQKQRRSFSGEINCELLNSLDSVNREMTDWPQLIEEVEASKSDTERDGCETVWNYSIKNLTDEKHVYGCVYNDKKVIKANERADDLSLKRPKLIVDDQLNLVDIENAIRNSTNLLNLSVFNVASDEEDSEMSNEINLELLKNRDKNLKNNTDTSSIVDDFELANDDFEFHITKSIGSNKPLPEILQNNQSCSKTGKTIINNNAKSTNLKETNSFKEIKLTKQDSTKVNGIFKKNSKPTSYIETNKLNSNKIEPDYRRKSITSITPLCSNTKPLLNGKQSKSVSDLTAQFKNCIQSNHQMPNKEKHFEPLLNGKRSTSESNLVFDSKDLLPTSTALMLQLIKQSNYLNKANESHKQLKEPIGSETITRKKKIEPQRTTSSASSSDANYSTYNSDDPKARRRRYLKKDEQQKINKQSMLPVPASNKKPRLQQPPPHFSLLSASGLSNGFNLPQTQLINKNIGSAALSNRSNHQIRSAPTITILNNAHQKSNGHIKPQQSTIYQPVYRIQLSSNHSQINNRPCHSNNLSAHQHKHRLHNRQNRELLHRSNSTTNLNLDANNCMLSRDLKKSMPNLSQSNLFPYNY